eukprot:gene3415-2424_t
MERQLTLLAASNVHGPPPVDAPSQPPNDPPPAAEPREVTGDSQPDAGASLGVRPVSMYVDDAARARTAVTPQRA